MVNYEGAADDESGEDVRSTPLPQWIQRADDADERRDDEKDKELAHPCPIEHGKERCTKGNRGPQVGLAHNQGGRHQYEK